MADKLFSFIKAHPAENLLKPETYRKWRCEKAGEKQASVIIEVRNIKLLNCFNIPDRIQDGTQQKQMESQPETNRIPAILGFQVGLASILMSY